jgi:preprotein translocase subunit SecG
MVYGLLVFVHVLVCVFLVIVVLLQSGKAADLAGAFGGMGSATAFGPRGTATLLSKLTRIAATLFMVTSLTLAIMATRGQGGPGTTVLEEQPSRGSQPVHSTPALPGPLSAPARPAGVQMPGGGKAVTIPIRPNAAGQKLPTAEQQAPAAPAKK